MNTSENTPAAPAVAPVAPPSQAPAPAMLPKSNQAMEHVLPTRNQPALLGYYYAIFGLLPVIGLVLAPVAIAYGIIGLDRGNRLPRNIGYGHALFATVAGIVGAIISYGMLVAVGVLLMMSYMGSTWPFPPEQPPFVAPMEELDQRLQKLEQLANPQRAPGRDAL